MEEGHEPGNASTSAAMVSDKAGGRSERALRPSKHSLLS